MFAVYVDTRDVFGVKIMLSHGPSAEIKQMFTKFRFNADNVAIF